MSIVTVGHDLEDSQVPPKRSSLLIDVTKFSFPKNTRKREHILDGLSTRYGLVRTISYVKHTQLLELYKILPGFHWLPV
jgi:hypothetical protein